MDICSEDCDHYVWIERCQMCLFSESISCQHDACPQTLGYYTDRWMTRLLLLGITLTGAWPTYYSWALHWPVNDPLTTPGHYIDRWKTHLLLLGITLTGAWPTYYSWALHWPVKDPLTTPGHYTDQWMTRLLLLGIILTGAWPT